MRYYLSPPPASPVSRILAGLLAILVLVGVFFFGLVILAAALSLGFLAWFVLTLRTWWFGRTADRPLTAGEVRGEGGSSEADARQRDAIDADYEVISRQEED
jgi:hypothetical protein